MKNKITDTDLEIVRHLWNGRTPYQEIAKKIGITTNTVRNRVNRMIEDGVLQIIGLVDPGAIAGHSSAFIGIKSEANKIKKVSQQFSELKGVVISACISGRFDIIACIMFNESYTYADFIFNELPKVKGIVSIETFFVAEGEKFNLRYVL
ncbi:MAG: Lrp/AsnC family transcriptional regulator [Deltaproteobacteria bacterium]|nr:Lrp/AsnC family transcriptional regulator [Deltaproteobacteria bacterium]